MVNMHGRLLRTEVIFLGTMPKKRLKLPPIEYATPETFGQRLARIRKERGLTQVELAQKVGIIQSIVTSYEVGRLRMHPEMVVRMARALDVTTDELLGNKTSRPLGEGKLTLKVVRRLSKIESLPEHEQRVLLKTIDTFLKASGA